jgi:DoxX-like family
MATNTRSKKVSETNTFQQSEGAASKMLWAGYTLTGIVVLFMLMDGGMKLIEAPVSVQATAELGYPTGVVRGLGIILLLCTALYAFPRTTVLGAILLTAWLGGAVATHVRVGSPLFSHVLLGVHVGAFVWGGVFLRDPRMRALLPWSR